MTNAFLLIPIVFLLAGAAGMITLSSGRTGMKAAWPSLLACAYGIITTAIFFFEAVHLKIKLPVEKEFLWLSLPRVKISLGFYVDGAALAAAAALVLVFLLLTAFAVDKSTGNPARKIPLFSLFCGALLAAVFANSLVFMTAAAELAALAHYYLSGCGTPSQVDPGHLRRRYIVSRTGSALLLCAALCSVAFLGTDKIPQLASGIPTRIPNTAEIAAVSILLAAGIAAKASLFPFSGMAAAKTIVSPLSFAAYPILLLSWIYVGIRVFPALSASPAATLLLGGAAAVSAAVCALAVFFQRDLYVSIVFIIIAHTATGLLGLAAGAYPQAALHFTLMTVCLSLLTLCCAVIVKRTGNSRFRELNGLLDSMPAMHNIFIIALLCLCCAPPLAGFQAYRSIAEQLLPKSQYLYFLFLLLIGLNTAALVRIYILTFHGVPDRHTPNTFETSFILLWPPALLAVLAFFAGPVASHHSVLEQLAAFSSSWKAPQETLKPAVHLFAFCSAGCFAAIWSIRKYPTGEFLSLSSPLADKTFSSGMLGSYAVAATTAFCGRLAALAAALETSVSGTIAKILSLLGTAISAPGRRLEKAGPNDALRRTADLVGRQAEYISRALEAAPAALAALAAGITLAAAVYFS